MTKFTNFFIMICLLYFFSLISNLNIFPRMIGCYFIIIHINLVLLKQYGCHDIFSFKWQKLTVFIALINTLLVVLQLDSCTDSESFVRVCPTLTTFFLFCFYN